MKRRLGRLGVFVEVDGKHYLSEERLKEIQEQRLAEGEMRNARKRIMTLRLVQLITVIIAIAVLLANLFVKSPELRTVSAVFLVVWVLIMMLQVYYLSRIRRRAL
jgi:membrane protein YdbS with pleckstrin-like domain